MMTKDSIYIYILYRQLPYMVPIKCDAIQPFNVSITS